MYKLCINLHTYYMHTIITVGGVIMVVQTTTRFTIYTRPELKALTETIAKETKTSRSKVVSKCLEELARQRTMELMEEGYKALAKEHRQFAKLSAQAASEVVPDWK